MERVLEEVETKERAAAPAVGPAATAPSGPLVDREQAARLLEQLREEENLPLALIVGAVAAIVGAGLWGTVTALTHYKIGWMAMAVGIIVGGAVRWAGKGLGKSFGITGASMALLGCLLGNALVVYLILAQKLNVSVLQIMQGLPPSQLAAIMRTSATPLDLIFYGIAVYEGYRFSFRRVTRGDVERLRAVR